MGRKLLRRMSRAALASTFVSLGWDAYLNPAPRAPKAALLGLPNPVVAVTLNGGAMVVAGVALAAGVAPRLMALVLAALMVPTTLGGHAFWHESDPRTRAQQRLHFFKNLAMLAGLLEVVLAEKPARA